MFSCVIVVLCSATTISEESLNCLRRGNDGFSANGRESRTLSLAERVAYQSACSLQHGQRITTLPINLLQDAGYTVVEPTERHLCCGSAGIHNLVRPEAAEELGRRKAERIRATVPDLVATGNPGCLLQLINGAKNEGLNLRVAHPVTLLAEAYREHETHNA